MVSLGSPQVSAHTHAALLFVIVTELILCKQISLIYFVLLIIILLKNLKIDFEH